MMQKLTAFAAFIFFLAACKTSSVDQKKKVSAGEVASLPSYRAAYTEYTDLIHTCLYLTPVWNKKEMKGRADITMKQHFYPSDSVVLNARGMEIMSVKLSGDDSLPLKYDYDSELLTVRLPRNYAAGKEFTLSIGYISRPDKLKEKGSSAIKRDIGLYFIDPDSSDDYNPTELWTQGETESNSSWFPTIESPSQKMTFEVFLTVDTALTTLSNGLLTGTVRNSDGTKTDHWMQSLPAAPYLSMIAAGNFSIVRDKWKDKEVSYYVDPPYVKYARDIFGKTPLMIDHFSGLLKVPFAWEKYSELIVHNYISGAMENASATVFGTAVQQTRLSLQDKNFEDIISHELFHHWFGDLVTCRSWSNITLNEGFANYAPYLWREFQYGRESADQYLHDNLSGYLHSSEKSDPPLIRYQYESREDVFDGVSYNKGGCIIHMLRKYCGDEAFFASLNDYLSEHRFGSAEADDLRHSFEKITGEDLHWFFDQWFLRSGYPVLKINYKWNADTKTQTIILVQTQYPETALYKLPLDVDFYFNEKKERIRIMMTKQQQEFSFSFPEKPSMVIVDAERALAGKRQDNKTSAELLYQYRHGALFMDRLSALAGASDKFEVGSPEAEIVKEAFNDHSEKIRAVAMAKAVELAKAQPDSVKDLFRNTALNDSSSTNRTYALQILSDNYPYSSTAEIFDKASADSSYYVKEKLLSVYTAHDSLKALALAARLENDSDITILMSLSEYFSKNPLGDKTLFYRRAIGLSSRWRKESIIAYYTNYLGNSKKTFLLEKGFDVLSKESSYSNGAHYRQTCITALRKLETLTADLSAGFKPDAKAGQAADAEELFVLHKKIKERLAELE